ncbi:MAG: hypothetical protein JXA19_01620 [Anaerolineales bacterium]|nr:hypothetical protein [Anaerolineales bacterium]
MKKEFQFHIGDWFVHKFYGVGQIITKEIRPIHGEPKLCFTIKSNSGTYWLPIENTDTHRVRLIAEKSTLEEVKLILQKEPEKMDQNYKVRRRLIQSIMENESVLERAALLRDLRSRSRIKGLNSTEEEARAQIREQLTLEYAIRMNATPEIAWHELIDAS